MEPSDYAEAFLDAARYCEDEDLNNMKKMFLHCSNLVNFKTLVDEAGRSPLMLASGNGHLDCVRFLLLEVGVNVNYQNESGNTALHWAALNGHCDCVDFLIENDANVSLANAAGKVPFDEALVRDRKDCCERIAKKEVELIMQNEAPEEACEEEIQMD